MPLIIRTNLKDRSDLGRSQLIHSDDKRHYFKCNCGLEFSLRSTNRYVSDEQYACANCKRYGHLAPNIGERYVFRRIRADAKNGGRSFEIGFDWFVVMSHSPCHYCGMSNGNSTTVPSKVAGTTLLKDFRYNGLDRINNGIGYREDNCVPCCIICNRAKNSMPYPLFVSWINNLVQYRKGLLN